MITPEPKPNPADPIWNPPAVPEIAQRDLSLATLNEPPVPEPDSPPPLIEPDHPFGRATSSSA